MVQVKTERVDWVFLVPAIIIFFSALLVTVLEYIVVQGSAFHISLMTLAGLVTMITGVTIRVVARMTLKKHFTHGLRTSSNHQLVMNGIYKHLRHPAYLGSLLFSPGIPLFFSSTSGFFIMLLLVPCFLYRIRI
ncbi:MAG: methyltransferase family protein [Candidatus Odinarchaeota archaeon]